jgi:AraC-like DNA-binding protein/mannose-6-phosphate isomerase-like protein (cupin superfamily)
MRKIMLRTLKTEEWFHRDGFPIAVERRDPQPQFGPHNHEFSEIVLITKGRGLHVAGQESWPLSAGDIFVIGGPVAHDYRNLDNLCLVNILFQPGKINLKLHDLSTLPGYHALFNLEPAWRRRHQFNSRLHVPPQELAVIMGMVDQLDRELKTRRPGYGFMATAVFMQIVGYLSRCYGGSQNPDSRALLRIAEAIAFLETHSDEQIQLSGLARIASMSRRSFIRAFQAATGTSPIAYLIRQRISRAATLLRQNDRSISEIAFEVGFSDSNYFTRQFRKAFGFPPSQYRERQGRIG